MKSLKGFFMAMLPVAAGVAVGMLAYEQIKKLQNQ
jgi:hypothetical protein